MPSHEDTLELRLELEGEDEEAVAADAARLRRRLLELDVVDVKRAPAETAPGAKGAATELGALLVTLGPPMIGAVMAEVRAWLARRGSRGLTVTLEGRGSITITGGLTDEERARLIDEFVRSGES